VAAQVCPTRYCSVIFQRIMNCCNIVTHIATIPPFFAQLSKIQLKFVENVAELGQAGVNKPEKGNRLRQK